MPLSPSLETVAATVASHCQSDTTFDQNFRKDPQSALQKKFGAQPSTLQLQLHDNDENNWHIVLPDLKAREQSNRLLASGKPLSDEDIASISGGDFLVNIFIGFFTIVTVSVFVTAASIGATTGGIIGTIVAATITE